MIIVVLETPRLLLRPLQTSDVRTMQQLLNHREITDTMEDYPYPYPVEAAYSTVAWSERAPRQGKGFGWAITRKDDRQMIGAIFLKVFLQPPEIGYWLGLPYWGQGYASEAANEVLRYAFETLRLPLLAAYANADNLGSRRVLEKLGMQLQHVRDYPKPGTDELKAAAYYELTIGGWIARQREL